MDCRRTDRHEQYAAIVNIKKKDALIIAKVQFILDNTNN
jgi:hypothetical protein